MNRNIAEVIFQYLNQNHLLFDAADGSNGAFPIHNGLGFSLANGRYSKIYMDEYQDWIEKVRNQCSMVMGCNGAASKDTDSKGVNPRGTASKGKIGAIVMNCNPFTYGHRHLIKEAGFRVDYLYVFVVEEDKSVFPFAERFRMVQDGTKDIRNVIVVPSGKGIISNSTLAEYFSKETLDRASIDNYEKDLYIFGAKIAPDRSNRDDRHIL